MKEWSGFRNIGIITFQVRKGGELQRIGINFIYRVSQLTCELRNDQNRLWFLIFHAWRPDVFDIRCLIWNTAIIKFTKDAAWTEDDIKVVTEFPCFFGTPCMLQIKRTISVISNNLSFKEGLYRFTFE